MKCLTICQPYAHLIATPQHELPDGFIQKRCENRTWNCRHRGPLLIHAGKSKRFLTVADERLAPMQFGSIVGVCAMVDCLRWSRGNIFTHSHNGHAWMTRHPHAEGPYCFILEDVLVRRIDRRRRRNHGNNLRSRFISPNALRSNV